MGTDTKTKIAIIEDHHSIRDGMAYLINSEPGFEAMPFS
jgi:hypothetical protein